MKLNEVLNTLHTNVCKSLVKKAPSFKGKKPTDRRVKKMARTLIKDALYHALVKEIELNPVFDTI